MNKLLSASVVLIALGLVWDGSTIGNLRKRVATLEDVSHPRVLEAGCFPDVRSPYMVQADSITLNDPHTITLRFDKPIAGKCAVYVMLREKD